MNPILKWLNKSTSKAGLAMLVSAVGSALGGAVSWEHAIPLVAAGIISAAIPDNSVLQKDVEALVADAVQTAVDAKTKAEPVVEPAALVAATPVVAAST